MAFNYPSYQIPQMPMTPSAFQTGMQSGLQASQGVQQSMAMPEQIRLAQQMKQAQLQSLQNQNQVQPQMLQAQLAQRQAQVPLTKEQTRRIQEQINEMPLDQAIKAQNTFNQAQAIQQSRDRFSGAAYQMKQALMTTAGRSLYASNPHFAAAADRIMSNTASQLDNQLVASQLGISLPQGQGANGAHQNNLIPSFQQGFGIQLGAQQPAAQQQLTNLGQVSEEQRNQASGITPKDVVAGQGLQKSVNIKASTPTAIQQQRQYHETLDSLINQMEPLIPSVAKYSGIDGQAKLRTDQIMASLGIPSKDYENYKIYSDVVSHLSGNDLRKMLGESATDSQIQEMKKYLTFGGWDVPSSLVLKKFNAFKDSTRNIGAALGKSQGEVEDRLKQLTSLPEGAQSSLSSLKTPTMPASVTNDDQFESWFRSLSPEQRAAYKSANAAKAN